MNTYVIFSLVLVIVAIALTVFTLVGSIKERSYIDKRFKSEEELVNDRFRFLTLGFIKSPEAIKKKIDQDTELASMLWMANLRTTQQKYLYFVAALLLPVVLLAVTALYHWVSSEGLKSPLLTFFFVGVLGYLAPKRILSNYAEGRKNRLVDEVPVFIQMLKILFDSGLSVDQSLRIIVQEARIALPETSKELDAIIRRTTTGMDLAEELDHSARQLKIDEFSDVVSILKQMIRQGGSSRASLSKLSDLVTERRMTALQEKVSKISAKMTMVMITFMFPALLIVIAAPGFLAITKAFARM